MNLTRIIFSLLAISLLFISDSAAQEKAAEEPSKKGLVTEEEAAANRAKAKVAWERDRQTLKAEEFAEMEKEYQEINKNYKSPQVKELLDKFITKWKTGNRVGCATLYLGQKSSGELRVTLLKKCAGEFSDCYYLDGTQVGGLARVTLAMTLQANGKKPEAKKLIEELRKDFPTAQDHRRLKLVENIDGIGD